MRKTGINNRRKVRIRGNMMANKVKAENLVGIVKVWVIRTK